MRQPNHNLALEGRQDYTGLQQSECAVVPKAFGVAFSRLRKQLDLAIRPVREIARYHAWDAPADDCCPIL